MKAKMYLSAALAGIVLSACGGENKPKQEVEEPDSVAEEMMDNQPAEGVVGLVYDATMNNVCILTEAGDSTNYSIMDAKDNGKVLGGIALGDKLLILPADKQGVANEVVNLTTLMGSWVYDNGAGDKMGFTLQDGGIAHSINMETLSYKKWEMNGDKILLTTVSEGSGSPTEMTDTCDILLLTSDSLQLNTHYEEGDQITKYSRKK